MAYLLFILVNAALFIRPAEIVPAMLGWEVYFYVIVACFAVALPEVLHYLTGQSPDTQPITLAILGLLVLIPISSLLNADAAEAWRTGFYFAKVIVYYLLFVSLVTTPARLRMLLICILIFSGTATALAVLRYHDVIELDGIKAVKDHVQGAYGETVAINRLQGTGIFQDPNDLCVLLAAMVPIGLYFVFTDRNLVLRGACAGLLPLFGYAVYLTHSRGGFLAFAGGLAGLAWSRYGWRKAALIGVVGLPLLLVLFAGRQTEINISTGTAQTRFELWRDWLGTFRANPAIGKGMTLDKDEDAATPDVLKTEEETRHAAHNAYLQAFADLGVLGGFLFVGAFLTAGWSIYRFGAAELLFVQRDLKQMQPYVLAAVAAYCIGMMTLSITYIIPTYLMLALSVAYTRLAQRSCLARRSRRCDLIFSLSPGAAAGVATLGSIYVFARFLA